MKKRNLLIILLLIFCSYSCEPFVEYYYSIRIPNNTSETIQVYEGYNYPDTRLNLEKPKLIPICPNEQNMGLTSKRHWKYKLWQSDTLSIFILSKDTVDAYRWEDIRNGYKILQRYDLSLEDLDKLKYHIPYPPSQTMRYMKMYPPYNE